MRTRLRRARLVLLAAGVLAALTVLAGPARAAPSCLDGTVCFWSEQDFSDDKALILDPLPGVCMTLPFAASSAMNTTADSTVRVYTGSDCDRQIGVFGPGEVPVIFPAAGSYVIL
ncbi:MAG: peptidase inhibitor family I36 protein [Egibacteraceae bacterium]